MMKDNETIEPIVLPTMVQQEIQDQTTKAASGPSIASTSTSMQIKRHRALSFPSSFLRRSIFDDTDDEDDYDMKRKKSKNDNSDDIDDDDDEELVFVYPEYINRYKLSKATIDKKNFIDKSDYRSFSYKRRLRANKDNLKPSSFHPVDNIQNAKTPPTSPSQLTTSQSSSSLSTSTTQKKGQSTTNWITPLYEHFHVKKQKRTFEVMGVRVTLQVRPSEIPNAGDGLFLSFTDHGDTMKWVVPPEGIDLGVYAPHNPEEIKSTLIMEAKNFLFDWKMQEFSFEGYDDTQLDITDKNGNINDHCHPHLLYKINEIRQNTRMRTVDPIFDGQKKLHYILRGGSTFLKNKSTELYTVYGKEYDQVRDRKYQTVDEKEIVVPSFAGFVPSISEYSENDVMDVLTYFFENTPDGSEARWRMVYATERIEEYCAQVLYIREGGKIPLEVRKLIDCLKEYFPQKETKEEDMLVMEKNQLLGGLVRKDNRDGTVEKVLSYPRKGKSDLLKYKIAFKDKQTNEISFEEWNACDTLKNWYYGRYH